MVEGNALTDTELSELEAELAKHPAPDAKYLTIDGKDYSPRMMFEEMKNGTPLGREFLQNRRNIMQLVGTGGDE